MKAFFACPLLYVLMLFLSATTVARADDFDSKWFKIKGQWTGKELRANSIQLRYPGKEPERGQVSGRIDTVDREAGVIVIGPVTIEWSDATEFEELQPHDLKPGVSVEVSGRLIEPLRMAARSIELESESEAPGILQIIGLTTASRERPNGTRDLKVLSVPVYATQNGFNIAKSLTRRQDSRRREDPFALDLFGRPLFITGDYELTPSYRDNFDLDDDDPDNSVELEQELEIEFFYPFTEFAALFLSFGGSSESEFPITGEDDNHTELALARDETWLFFDRIGGSGFGLQVGRQNIAETREWWWDDDLDALRLYYDHGPFHFEVAGGEQLGGESTLEDIDPLDEDVARVLGLGSWLWASKQRLELFVLHQWDRSGRQTLGSLVKETLEDPSDGDLTWFGLRTIGDRSLDDYGDLLYWADVGWVRGEDAAFDFEDVDDDLSRVASVAQRDMSGWAFDLGASWTAPVKLEPTFTLSYARASGDDNADDRTDHAFRQTGLQGNKWRFRGVNRFRYYGELLRPELSNLRIATGALGFPLLRNSSIELLYHHYDQVHAARTLRDARVNDDPNGTNRDIGQEWDIVLNFREWRQLELGWTGAVFKAGDAYGRNSGEIAYSLFFEIIYNF